jgi:putative serine protease PepD
MLSLGDGPEVRADVVAYVRMHDIAVLRPAGDLGGTPVELGDDAAVEVGDALVAYGHPNGATETLTRGMVNAHARRDGQLETFEGSADTNGYRNAIQTDAPLAPGNSGGPVATRDGRVIGLVSGGGLGTGMIVPARHIRTALRMVERANGRPVGPWPAHTGSYRVAAPGEREGEHRMLPANASLTSRVTVRSEADRTRFAETRPDGRTRESTLTDRAYSETHAPPPTPESTDDLPQ